MHGDEVVQHFLFVVYAVKRCVDGFVEGAPAACAAVALYAEVSPRFVKSCAGAARTCKSRYFGGEGKSRYEVHYLSIFLCLKIIKDNICINYQLFS